MQVGIVLFIYSLVWMWLRANTLRLLWSNQGASYRKRVIEAPGAPISLPRTRLALRQAHFFGVRARHAYRRGDPRAKRVSKKLPASPRPPFVKGGSQDFLGFCRKFAFLGILRSASHLNL